MFRRLVVNFLLGGQAAYQDTSDIGSFGETEALEIYFNSFRYESDNSTLRHFRDCLSTAGIDWLCERHGRWTIDPAVLKLRVPVFRLPEWLDRKVPVTLEVVQFDDEFAGQARRMARVFVRIEKSELQLNGPVFLSHKSKDKGLVRDIATALELVGVSAWLDERAMAAGAHLERSLSNAFKEARAAVFFVTPSYEDRGYLAAEIDYAIREKRTREDFSLITIRIGDDRPEIPELLRSYVWKDVTNGLQALIEILKALQLR
jgi:hypothetical protein